MEDARSLNNRHSLEPTLNRHAAFVLFSVVGVILFGRTLLELARFSLASATYDFILIIPAISLWLIHMKRKKIFAVTNYSFGAGPALALTGLVVFLLGRQYQGLLASNDELCVATLAAVIFWAGAFLTAYGFQAFRAALFPLLMLIFMVPPPVFLHEMIVTALQRGSTEATSWLFALTGVPVLREGFVFALPGLTIEVAKECSGIRSGLSLVILSLVEGHLFLRTLKNRVMLVLAAIFITVFKNGLRIATLSLLGIYVDQRIISSDLHRKGGIPFFVLAFTMLTIVLWAFRRREMKNG